MPLPLFSLIHSRQSAPGRQRFGIAHPIGCLGRMIPGMSFTVHMLGSMLLSSPAKQKTRQHELPGGQLRYLYSCQSILP